MEKRYVLTEEEVAMIQGMSLRIEQLQKENEELRRDLKGTENQLNAKKLRLEHLRDTLSKVRAKYEGLKAASQVSQPAYTAVITIDSWHCDGKHFPSYYGFARGNTPQEAYDHALMKLRLTYKLTDVTDKAVMGSNFLYADNREANIIITKSN